MLGKLSSAVHGKVLAKDNIVEGIVKLLNKPPVKTGETAAHRIFNIGNNRPKKRMSFINALENALISALSNKVEFVDWYVEYYGVK